jgi:hypothetical protein
MSGSAHWRNFFPSYVFLRPGTDEESMMHSILSKGFVALAMSGALMMGGCATTESVERAQASADAAAMRADAAFAAAQTAQQRADAAGAAAQEARAAADRAQAAAASASSSVEAVRNERVQSTRLARGERG